MITAKPIELGRSPQRKPGAAAKVAALHTMAKAGVENPIQVATTGQQAIDYLRGAGKFANRARFSFPCLVLRPSQAIKPMEMAKAIKDFWLTHNALPQEAHAKTAQPEQADAWHDTMGSVAFASRS